MASAPAHSSSLHQGGAHSSSPHHSAKGEGSEGLKQTSAPAPSPLILSPPDEATEPSQIPAYGPTSSSLPEQELEALPTRVEYLYEEFRDADEETPLVFRCAELVDRPLTKFDFLDRGLDTSPAGDRPRFQVRHRKATGIFEVVDLLQLTITEMSKLTKARKTYQVDPKGVIRDAFLRGRDSIKDIVWAHALLRLRVANGAKVVEKLYTRDKGYEALSPATTVSSLWENMELLSPNSRLKGFLRHPQVSRTQEEVESYNRFIQHPQTPLSELVNLDVDDLTKAFPAEPIDQQGQVQFWNRQTNELSSAASSYEAGKDWQPPVGNFTDRTRQRSTGGVRFEEQVRTNQDVRDWAANQSYGKDASSTPLASTNQKLAIPETPARGTSSTGFLATSTPYRGGGGGNDQTQNDSFAYNTSALPAGTAGWGQDNSVNNPNRTIPPYDASSLPAGTAGWGFANTQGAQGIQTAVGDTSLLNFLDQGLPVKDIGVPVDNILPDVQPRFSSRPSFPGGYVNPQAWNPANVNMGITAHGAAPLNVPHLAAGQQLPGGGIAPPDAGQANVLRQGIGAAPGAPGGGGSPHSGDSAHGNGPPYPPGWPNQPPQGPPPPLGPGFPVPPGGGGFPGGGGGGFPGGGGGGFFPPGGGFPGRGREHELPRDFIQARLLLLRALLTVPPGSAEEVREVMRTAPIVWKTMIDLDRIPDTPTLVRRVSDRDRELIVAASRGIVGDSHGVSKDYLDAQIARAVAQMRMEQSTGKKPWPRKDAKMAEMEDLLDMSGPVENPPAMDEQLDAEVYALELRKQRPPPLGGYPYPRDDTNRTRLKKPPPSPWSANTTSRQ
ncbi:hypothetical protein C8R47DRAFT_1078180 [Mycena vitilis]|nr:hypothetical protein C8R47DRAFT_1078180 [Mycena vitilis]